MSDKLDKVTQMHQIVSTERPSTEEVVTDERGQVIGQEVSVHKLRFPQLILTQALSSLVTNGPAQPGQFWNSLVREQIWPLEGVHLLDKVPDELKQFVVGERDGKALLPLFIVPTVIFEDRVCFGEDTVLCRSERGGLRAAEGFKSPAASRMSDPQDCYECPLSKWTGEGSDREPPQCSERINIFCALPFVEGLPQIVVPFMRTSMAAGQAIATTTHMEHLNPWALTWGLYCTHEKFSQGSAWVFRVKKIGYTLPELRETISEEARSLRDALRAGELDDAIDTVPEKEVLVPDTADASAFAADSEDPFSES